MCTLYKEGHRGSKELGLDSNTGNLSPESMKHSLSKKYQEQDTWEPALGLLPLCQ